MIMGRYRTGTAAMKKYQQLAQQLTEQIALGVWLRRSAAVAARAGDQQRHELYDRQPCLSAAGKRGRIVARPQSGYYVAPSR